MKIHVTVKPRAKQQKVETADDGSLLVYLTSPPVDGKANQELIKLLAKQFKVTQSEVCIRSGANSRHKIVEIADR